MRIQQRLLKVRALPRSGSPIFLLDCGRGAVIEVWSSRRDAEGRLECATFSSRWKGGGYLARAPRLMQRSRVGCALSLVLLDLALRQARHSAHACCMSLRGVTPFRRVRRCQGLYPPREHVGGVFSVAFVAPQRWRTAILPLLQLDCGGHRASMWAGCFL